MIRIQEYYAENFKRLRLVQFTPKGRVTAFTGKNDQGKSSALDAIPYVLGGKKWSPEVPKRRGAQHMKVRLDLGQLIVTRTESGVKIETAPGVTAWDTPQKMLDSLFDELAFDPLDFVRMKPEQQVELLKKSVKLTEDLDALTRQNAIDFAARRDINREVARLDAELSSITVQAGLPAEKLDEAAIEQQIEAANEHNRNMAHVIDLRNRLQSELAIAEANAERNEAFIAEAEGIIAQWERDRAVLHHRAGVIGPFVDDFRQLVERLSDTAFMPAPQLQMVTKAAFAEAESHSSNLANLLGKVDGDLTMKRDAIEAARQQTAALAEAAEKARTRLAEAPAPEVSDTTQLMQDLKQAQLVNREIDKRTRRDEVKKKRDLEQAKADKLTRAMDDRDERKARAVAEAKMPVEGLTFTEGAVLFEGIPLQQLGEAKQIKISIALVLARNPKLRLVIIKHGEALDDDSMAELQQLAEEQDFYVWMAKVDPSGKVGIVIEDGEVKTINEIS